jgi:hypothetical protein
MDLWDTLYYLAAKKDREIHAKSLQASENKGQSPLNLRVEMYRPGTIETSTRTLTELTGIDRRAIGEFLEETEQQGLIERAVSLVDGWGYAMIIKGYVTEQKGILKPESYISNGWIKAIRNKNNLALPKRLLNYYLGLPFNTPTRFRYDSLELGNLLRKQDLNNQTGQFSKEGFYRVAPGELAEAHYLLAGLGLLQEEEARPGFYRLVRERFFDLPPAELNDPLDEFLSGSLHREFLEQDAARLKWLVELLKQGHFPLNDKQVRLIWRDLSFLYGDQARFEMLRKKARYQRDNVRQEIKWSETWRLYLAELKKRTVTVETSPPYKLVIEENSGSLSVNWHSDLVLFAGQVSDPVLRCRLQPSVGEIGANRYSAQLKIHFQNDPFYIGPLNTNSKAVSLGSLTDIFHDPDCHFPMRIEVEGWQGTLPAVLELWFQGQKLKSQLV